MSLLWKQQGLKLITVLFGLQISYRTAAALPKSQPQRPLQLVQISFLRAHIQMGVSRITNEKEITERRKGGRERVGELNSIQLFVYRFSMPVFLSRVQ